jgi:CheY-like chemotaxis protein
MSVASPRVLIVEDDEAIRALLVAALRRESLDVDAARDGAEALQFTSANEYAVILLDLMMPHINGFEFLESFHREPPSRRAVIFVVTAFDDTMVGRLDPTHVHAILRKPFDVAQLVSMVREVAHMWHAADGQDRIAPVIRPYGDDDERALEEPAN